MSVQLLRAQLRRYYDANGYTLLPAADVPRVLFWSNYSAKTVAQIQARGMPIDMALWNLVQENKTAVIRELLRQFDPSKAATTRSTVPKASGATPALSAGSRATEFRGRAWTAANSIPIATPFASCITFQGSKVCMRCVTVSASSWGQIFRSGATVETGRVCSHSALPPAATPMPKACTTP